MKFTTLGYGSRAVEYHDALAAQRETHARVVAGGPNEILLLEHTPVYTAGKRTQPHERPMDGTPVIDVDRGGKITWHGPGQLVGYPIVQLGDARDVIRYVRRVEDVLMAACAAFGVRTVRIKGRSGVWVPADERGDARKIAALGIRVSRNVTMHGFAINCNNSLTPYHNIVPCGISDAGVTTLSFETGRDISVLDVVPHVESAILAGFLTEDRDADWQPPLAQTHDMASPTSRSHPIVAASTMPAATEQSGATAPNQTGSGHPGSGSPRTASAGTRSAGTQPTKTKPAGPKPVAAAVRAPETPAPERLTGNSATPSSPAPGSHGTTVPPDVPNVDSVFATPATTGHSGQPATSASVENLEATAAPTDEIDVDTPAPRTFVTDRSAGPQNTPATPAPKPAAAKSPEPQTELLNLTEIENTLAGQNAPNQPAISPVATTPPRIASYQEARPSPSARPAPSAHHRTHPGAAARPAHQSREPLIEGLVRKATATWQRFVGGSAKKQDRR